jgi:hypothetical protein
MGRAVRTSCPRPPTASQAREPDSPSGLRPLPHPWDKHLQHPSYIASSELPCQGFNPTRPALPRPDSRSGAVTQICHPMSPLHCLSTTRGAHFAGHITTM